MSSIVCVLARDQDVSTTKKPLRIELRIEGADEAIDEMFDDVNRVAPSIMPLILERLALTGTIKHCKTDGCEICADLGLVKKNETQA